MNRFARAQLLFLLGILTTAVVGLLCMGVSTQAAASSPAAQQHMGHHHGEPNVPAPCMPVHATFVGVLGQATPSVPFAMDLVSAFVLFGLTQLLAVHGVGLCRAFVRLSDWVWRFVRFRQVLAWIGQLRVLDDWHAFGGWATV